MKNSMRRAMISTVCMLIVAVMSLTGVTYAWFTQGTSGEVTGMEMTVTSTAGGVLISVDEGRSWGTNLAVETKEGAVSPVSTVGGEGAWVFYTASINENDSKKIMTAASAETNYIKEAVWLKNEGSAPITVALGRTDGLMTDITQKAGVEKNYKGHLASRLGIRLVGAVSTLDGETAAEGAKVAGGKYGIFEPNATMHLAGQGDAAASYLGVMAASGTNITAEETAEGGSVIKNAFDGYFDMTTATAPINGITYLQTVTPIQDATQFEIVIPAQSIVKLEVYVWLEGQDADCTNAVSSSVLDVSLCFELKQ